MCKEGGKIFEKVKQAGALKSQPHENCQTGRNCFQVVNQVKTNPKLAGYQIPFRGTRLSFEQVSIIEGSLLLLQKRTYTKPSLVPPKGI